MHKYLYSQEDYCKSREFQIQPIGKIVNIEGSGGQLVAILGICWNTTQDPRY